MNKFYVFFGIILILSVAYNYESEKKIKKLKSEIDEVYQCLGNKIDGLKEKTKEIESQTDTPETKTNNLEDLESLESRINDNEHNISVKVYKMSQAEIKALFQGRGRHLIKGNDAIIPLRIIVENRTNHTVTVKPATMAITDSQIIYKKVEKNIAGISAAASIGGFLLAGPVGAAAFGSGFGISNANKNKEILSEISQDAFVDPKEVYPQSTLNKIMFIMKSDFQPIFSLPIGSRMYSINLA